MEDVLCYVQKEYSILFYGVCFASRILSLQFGLHGALLLGRHYLNEYRSSGDTICILSNSYIPLIVAQKTLVS